LVTESNEATDAADNTFLPFVIVGFCPSLRQLDILKMRIEVRTRSIKRKSKGKITPLLGTLFGCHCQRQGASSEDTRRYRHSALQDSVVVVQLCPVNFLL
jgi:hypothetical protein